MIECISLEKFKDIYLAENCFLNNIIYAVKMKMTFRIYCPSLFERPALLFKGIPWFSLLFHAVSTVTPGTQDTWLWYIYIFS